jgi:hypothetical protein
VLVLVLMLVFSLSLSVCVCVSASLTSSAPFALLIWARARLRSLALIASLPPRPVHVEAAARAKRAIEFSILEPQCHSGRISSTTSREYNFWDSRSESHLGQAQSPSRLLISGLPLSSGLLSLDGSSDLGFSGSTCLCPRPIGPPPPPLPRPPARWAGRGVLQRLHSFRRAKFTFVHL